jgi:hypothetical protein
MNTVCVLYPPGTSWSMEWDWCNNRRLQLPPHPPDKISQRSSNSAGEGAWLTRCGLVTRSNPGADRTTGNHREVQRKREFIIERIDFDSTDDGRQSQRDLEHGEMVANA